MTFAKMVWFKITRKILNCLLVIVPIPTEGNRYNGPLYIITANFDSIMNIVTSYE